jgi:hypothetical protein
MLDKIKTRNIATGMGELRKRRAASRELVGRLFNQAGAALRNGSRERCIDLCEQASAVCRETLTEKEFEELL